LVPANGSAAKANSAKAVSVEAVPGYTVTDPILNVDDKPVGMYSVVRSTVEFPILNVAAEPVGEAYVPSTAPEKAYSAHVDDPYPKEDVTEKAI
tara:strand:- start:290 stop:571 length:282 start_codon:yes stop_codon:yes gene_type:complete